MRWLVSTLDALVTSLPAPEAERQRQQLSDLVMRYKELVPRLETTAVRLDGLAKCHTYRVEIDEVRGGYRVAGGGYRVAGGGRVGGGRLVVGLASVMCDVWGFRCQVLPTEV